MFTSPLEVFEYFGSFVNFERTQKQSIREYRLDRMKALLQHFGNPHDAMDTIHIAGSKGKGSTAAYLARCLESCGNTVGLYGSPHVSDYRERISAAGSFFPDKLYIEQGRRILEELENLRKKEAVAEAEPTAFELFTLLAFLVFQAAGCNIAVIETGIGGRLDATNVIHPLAAVITPIEREHTDLLGTSIDQIAREKAGIIKPKIPVFCAGQPHPAAKRIIEEKSRSQGGQFFYLPEEISLVNTSLSPEGTRTKARWLHPAERQHGQTDPTDLTIRRGCDFDICLSMIGTSQAENALLSLLCMKTLIAARTLQAEGTSFQSLFEKHFRAALASVRLPARMEIAGRDPYLVLDGAHTPVSLRRTVETFHHLFGSSGVCIFGAVEGKDIEGMAGIVSSAFPRVIISTPGSFKPNRPEEVFRIFRSRSDTVSFEPDPEKALQKALQSGQFPKDRQYPILVTGSFYMAAEIRSLVIPREVS